MMISSGQLILRLAVAALLGSMVGLERQRLDWAAGLRTHMMVCVGSALIVIVSAYGFNDVIQEGRIVLDPSRVAAQVVSGIGFLGAGTILFLRHEVIRGLTTAAGLWTVAGIGLAVGSGLFLAGIVTTVLALIILAAMKPLERFLTFSKKSRNISLSFDRRKTSIVLIEQKLNEQNLDLLQMVVQRGDSSNEKLLKLTLSRSVSQDQLTTLVTNLSAIEGVKEVRFQARRGQKVS